MTQKMTQEAILACELINYIEAEPKHYNGLCYYFSGGHAEKDSYGYYCPREALAPMAYNMIDAARQTHLQQYGTRSQVVNSDGPHPVRLAFAKDLLELVIKGKITFDKKNQVWDIK